MPTIRSGARSGFAPPGPAPSPVSAIVTIPSPTVVGSGGGAPDLPANTAVGTPCAHVIGWGDGNWVYLSQSTLQTWYTRGFHGYRFGTTQLYGHDQFDTDFKPSNSAASGSAYAWQQQLEPSGANHAAQAATIGYDIYNGWTLRSGVSSNFPPYGNWFDDPTWADVCVQLARWQAAADYMGFGGSMSLDSELSSWLSTGYSGNTHTAAQNRAKARQRGYELGLAMWGTNPATRLTWYNIVLPAGWNNKFQEVINADVYPWTDPSTEVDLLCGMFDAMLEVDATGEIVLCDFSFFRLAANFAPGAVDRAAYQMNSMASRAWLSTYFEPAVWAYAHNHLRIAAFTWKGKDGTDFYDATMPSDSTWALQQTNARQWSEGPIRAEYNGPQEGWPGGGGNIYASSTALAGLLAGASTTPLPTAVPTLTGPAGTGNPTAVRSGANITVSGRAAHLHGIYGVRVHRGSTWDKNNQMPSMSGVCPMTFTPNGGSYTTNFDNAYQQLAYTSTDGAWAGETYAVLVCTSIHDDVTYLAVTIT